MESAASQPLSLEEVSERLTSLCATEEANFEDFVSEQKSLLETEITSEEDTVALWTGGTDKFIGPQTKIRRSAMVDPFLLNDDSVYGEFLETLHQMYHAWGKPDMRAVIIPAINYFVGRYFGNHYPTAKTETANRQFYSEHDTEKSPTINLAEFKGRNIGVCTEKAALTHNLLKFVGINSQLICSYASRAEQGEEAHAYIAFATATGKFIYDPTNPSLVMNPERVVQKVEPGMYQIQDEEFEGITRDPREQVMVTHRDFIEPAPNQRQPLEETRIYR